MEVLIATGIFGVCALLLSVGAIFTGKSVRAKCGPTDPDAGEGSGSCQFCGDDSPGICAKESTETQALFDTVLAKPCDADG